MDTLSEAVQKLENENKQKQTQNEIEESIKAVEERVTKNNEEQLDMFKLEFTTQIKEDMDDKFSKLNRVTDLVLQHTNVLQAVMQQVDALTKDVSVRFANLH